MVLAGLKTERSTNESPQRLEDMAGKRPSGVERDPNAAGGDQRR